MLSPRQLAILAASPKAHGEKSHTLRVKVKAAERENLEGLAMEIGATPPVGINSGFPSIACLVRAIASGMVGVVDLETGRIHRCSNVVGNFPIRDFKTVLAECSAGFGKSNNNT